MANSKISALTAATTPLAGTEVLPIVQSSTTVKVAVSDLTAGRSVAMQKLTINYSSASIDPVTMVNTASGGKTWLFGGGTGGAAGDFGFYNSSDLVVSLLLKANGDITIPTGNLIPNTAAKGINFTANTALTGMTSQLLNWYEEGTYTPTFTNCGTASVGTARYTRIGRLVVVNMTMTATSITANSSRFTLPFTCGLLASGTFTRDTSEGGFVEAQTSSTSCYFATTPSSTTGTFIVTISYTV